MATGVFYSIISNFNYFRPKGCWFSCPVSCVFLLHVGLEITTLQIWPKVGKPLEMAGDQWVKKVGKINCVIYGIRHLVTSPTQGDYHLELGVKKMPGL